MNRMTSDILLREFSKKKKNKTKEGIKYTKNFSK